MGFCFFCCKFVRRINYNKVSNMKKIYIWAFGLGVACTLNGCSIIQGKGQGRTSATATRTQGAAAGDVSARTVTPKSGNKDKTGGKNQNVLVTKGPAVSVSDILATMGGEWTITVAGTTRIQRDEDMPYLCFVPDEHRFYGSNGCNVLNGDYAVSGDRLTFSNVLTTMQYCPGNDFDQKINAVVRDGSTVRVVINKLAGESILTMNDQQGRMLLTLRRHNMGFLNGYWLVTSIYGKSVDDEEANIFFDINELKIHGNTGCNYFNGNIYIDPSVSNQISFSGMGVTRMACPKSDQERNMLVALEETATAIQGNNDMAILMDGNGRQLLTLKRGRIPNASQE